MTDEKTFDGIILPARFTGTLGAAMGISQQTLGFGPGEIKINYAIPNIAGLDRCGLYWLENCPSEGPYSQRACNYWLLPEMSRVVSVGVVFEAETGIAVRVRPSTKVRHWPFTKNDFIFWKDGNAVSREQQYVVGINSARRYLGQGYSFLDVVKAWEKGEVEVKFSMPLAELLEKSGQVLGDIAALQVEHPRRRLKIESRDAGWPKLQFLASEFA